MNIKEIKKKADELLSFCKPQMIRICTIMMLINLISSLFADSNNSFISLLYFIISIFLLTLNHGYIVSSLKVVRNNADSLSDDDAFVGLRRFKELFPTYLMKRIIVIGISISLLMLMIIIVGIFLGVTMPFDGITPKMMINPSSAFLYLMYYFPSFIFIIIAILIVVIIVAMIIEGYLFPVPYLLEKYHLTMGASIKESFDFMKGHIKDYIKLELSFFGWVLLVGMILLITSAILSFLPFIGQMIASIFAGLAAIYLYYPKYIISLTIFFEEIAYYRYQQPQGEDAYE